jgi:hypothetical protein
MRLFDSALINSLREIACSGARAAVRLEDDGGEVRRADRHFRVLHRCSLWQRLEGVRRSNRADERRSKWHWKHEFGTRAENAENGSSSKRTGSVTCTMGVVGRCCRPKPVAKAEQQEVYRYSPRSRNQPTPSGKRGRKRLRGRESRERSENQIRRPPEAEMDPAFSVLRSSCVGRGHSVIAKSKPRLSSTQCRLRLRLKWTLPRSFRRLYPFLYLRSLKIGHNLGCADSQELERRV